MCNAVESNYLVLILLVVTMTEAKCKTFQNRKDEVEKEISVFFTCESVCFGGSCPCGAPVSTTKATKTN